MSLSRKDQEQQSRRGAILFAAGRLFTEKGFAGTTVAEIARRAEVSVGAIYQLFESKEALQSALLEEKASRLLAHAGGEPAAREVVPAGIRKLAGIELLFSAEGSDLWLGKTLSRREREVRSKRDDVFAAAARVFLERGFHGATMAEIARQAGVATGTLYNLFAGKEQLYLAMVEQKVDEFLLFMQMSVNAVPSPVDKIRRLIQAECAFFEENRAFREAAHFDAQRLRIGHDGEPWRASRGQVRRLPGLGGGHPGGRDAGGEAQAHGPADDGAGVGGHAEHIAFCLDG